MQEFLYICTTTAQHKSIESQKNLDEPLKKVNFGCAGMGDCSKFREISVLCRGAFRARSRDLLCSFGLI